MFQDIQPHSIDMGLLSRPVADDDWIVVPDGSRLWMVTKGGERRFPAVGEIRRLRRDGLIPLFSVDGTGLWLCLDEVPPLPGLAAVDMREFRTMTPRWQAFAGVTAGHLGAWYMDNRYCGRCGEPMAPKTDERAMACGCGRVVYPRISPAVITGVVDGERILLTRYNRPGSALTALIAGFMEVGEMFEDTVRREVMEEVGLRVKNIRYYKSQPWAFSGSVLAGFYADLDGSPELKVDGGELAEARWLERGELREDAEAFSLTAEMVDVFRQGRHPR